MAFVLVFCLPCALMSIVLTPPILLPDCWFIFPTCVISLASSFAPFIISLFLQYNDSSSSNVLCSCLVLPCQALLPAVLLFPNGSSIGLFCLFLLSIKSPSLCSTESLPHPSTQTLTLTCQPLVYINVPVHKLNISKSQYVCYKSVTWNIIEIASMEWKWKINTHNNNNNQHTVTTSSLA